MTLMSYLGKKNCFYSSFPLKSGSVVISLAFVGADVYDYFQLIHEYRILCSLRQTVFLPA